jgi:hypothetical protein
VRDQAADLPAQLRRQVPDSAEARVDGIPPVVARREVLAIDDCIDRVGPVLPELRFDADRAELVGGRAARRQEGARRRDEERR